MKIAGYPVHPAANFFPLIEGPEFDEFALDIKKRGLQEKVVLFEGKILDGRNRARACVKTKTTLKTRVYKGKDPVGYVVSLNLKRRHLSESQRAMAACKIAEASHGGDRRSSGRSAARTQTEAAEIMQTSPRTVRQAKYVRKHGDQALVYAVEQGHVAVSLAEKLTAHSPAAQRQVAKKASQGDDPAKLARELNRQKRAQKMTSIKSSDRELDTSTQYGVIMADPPWTYEEGTTTPSRRVDNHYPQMTLAEICAMPVAKLALDSCVLGMWVPAPLIFEVVPPVLEAWGFNYKSQHIWHKLGRRGTGYWGQMEHEIFILASRGDAPPPPVKARFPSVHRYAVGEHSVKPPEFRKRLELMYPEASRIELFAREAAPKWEVWGNQSATPEAKAPRKPPKKRNKPRAPRLRVAGK